MIKALNDFITAIDHLAMQVGRLADAIFAAGTEK